MAKPILESVAKVLIINQKSEVLILTVGEYKARPDKSFKPDLPGGLVDYGETELAAVVRELNEETGIKASPKLFKLVYAETDFFEKENKSVSKFLYLATLTEIPVVTISWEHSGYSWVPLSDLMDSVELRPFYRHAIKYCFSHRLL